MSNTEFKEDDLVLLRVQREQLATMDLDLLMSQVANIVSGEGSDKEHHLALKITYDRLKNNLVAGALAERELKERHNR